MLSVRSDDAQVRVDVACVQAVRAEAEVSCILVSVSSCTHSLALLVSAAFCCEDVGSIGNRQH